MSSNNYNPYNYPYQQSSAQQYSTYPTAPASNNQPSRQYQPTTQATDYMSYQAPSYGNNNAYSGAQDSSWSGGNYSGNRETTSRAAEVLRNMSNTAYAPNSTAATHPGFTATNSGSGSGSRYSSSTTPTSQGHATAPSYGQTQARPRSVNTSRAQSTVNRGITSPAMAAGYPSQRATHTSYSQQPQRTASPAQPQYAQNTQASASTARTAAISAAYNNEYPRRQLPNPDVSRTAHPASTSYSYTDTQSTAPLNPVPETYGQSTTTVDPMAVYDPWPEYQRKQETLRAQKAEEDAARAEEERKAEALRKEEERKREEEEEQKRKEEEEKARLAQMNNPKPPKSRKSQQSAPAATNASSAASAFSGGDGMEDEIRALMAKMREFNSKDPALLARIWEEERRAKAPNKSPPVQSKPAPQAAPSAPTQTASTVPPATMRKKAASKAASTPVAAKATPVVALPVPKPSAVPAVRSNGTVWPPEKKVQLASAAAAYLKNHNPSNSVDAAEVLRMLDGNPSYIELCEQLEKLGLKLDRATFAKDLLTAVPDVNSASRAKATQSSTAGVNAVNGTKIAPPAVMKTVAPPAVMKNPVGTPATPAAGFTSAASPAENRPQYPPFPDADSSAAPTPAPVAEMVAIKPELKPPVNKEEAARKRTFNDLIDLTMMPEDEDFDPPPKKLNLGTTDSYGSPTPFHDGMEVNKVPANFPLPARPAPPQYVPEPGPLNEFRHKTIVEPLDRKKALRRNTYNIATIARDVLLACGRHPDARQLNQHLEILKTTLPQVTNDSDLSTLRWDLIDPGRPPPGYFVKGVQHLTEDADDEEDSEDENRPAPRPRESESTSQDKAQARPEAVNPFKRRGRPPRHSFPGNPTAPTTPKQKASVSMSASAPRPAVAGVGYSAFRSATEYDAEGKPLPKKKGRPVGWRKNIHGSAAAQARTVTNGHTSTQNKPSEFIPAQPSGLRNVATGRNEPIQIDSRSPSAPRHAPQYQSFTCKWQGCKAELHNLDTLRKHVSKVHRKESASGMLECFWANCGTEVAVHDPVTNLRIERHEPKSFSSEQEWNAHLDQEHFQPLSWNLGDGPASGLSDATDSEAYLSDAQGRRVTPRIVARPEYLEDIDFDTVAGSTQTEPSSAPRGRGRPKNQQERESREVQDRLVSQKRRIGGPGMDRGGATLVNEKRRRGFSDNDETEEELVDVE
ncbi:hypothetical protein CC80DRAFT_366230, partial [Byssothecium circinans]